MSDWEDFRVFLAVLDTGGFAAAGEAMDLTHATVRACVERLEHRAGAALFIRAPEGLTATPAGRAVGETARNMAAAVGAFGRLASAEIDGMSGRVRIAVASEELLAIDLLPRSLLAVREALPGLILELGVGVGWDDLAAGAADLLIRLEQPDREDLAAIRVGVLTYGLFGHRRLIARVGAPDKEADLLGLPLVGHKDPRRLRRLFGDLDLSLRATRPVLCADSRAAQLAAVRAGLGFGVCPLAVAADDPDLIRVLPQSHERRGVWFATPRIVADVRRVAAVRDILAAEFAARLS